MEREPGDPGLPYDPEAPDRLQGRSASEATPTAPAPYGGPAPRRGGHPAWRGWAGGGLIVAGIIALMSLANTGDRDDDAPGSSASVIAVPADVSTIRVQTTSDDIRIDQPDRTTTREVTVDNGSARSTVEGSVLVLRPEDDAELRLPPGVRLEVRTTSGDVDGEGLDVPSATVQSTSGDVDLGWREVPTSVEVRTTSGNVDLELPPDDYNLTTRTSSGEERTGRTVPDAANQVEVRTTSGDITVEN